MSSYTKQQALLQDQAHQVIKRLGLMPTLEKHGQVEIVGSLKHGLMTWRDIDLNVVTQSCLIDEIFWPIVHTIFPISGVKSVHLADNRTQLEKKRPKSLYLGIKYEDVRGEIWKIDIRFLDKQSVQVNEIDRLLMHLMTGELKEIILHIKSQVDNDPQYHRSFSSVDIYKAVLLGGVKDLSAFRRYLANR